MVNLYGLIQRFPSPTNSWWERRTSRLSEVQKQKADNAKNQEDEKNEEQRKQKLDNDNFENKILQRQEYAKGFLCIAKAWLIFVVAVICLNGVFRVCTSRTFVSNSVLLALIGTSLGVVLAPASLIGGSLFKEKE